MTKPRPDKKPTPAPRRVLPMDLQVGDRLSDETGEWEVVGRPYTTAGGKNARVRVQRVGQPAVSELRTWRALFLDVRSGLFVPRLLTWDPFFTLRAGDDDRPLLRRCV